MMDFSGAHWKKLGAHHVLLDRTMLDENGKPSMQGQIIAWEEGGLGVYRCHPALYDRLKKEGKWTEIMNSLIPEEADE